MKTQPYNGEFRQHPRDDTDDNVYGVRCRRRR